MKIASPSLIAFTLLGATKFCFALEPSGVQLDGMSQEIFVQAAEELGIEAPSGKNVAVLDQSWVGGDSETSQVPDHHNGFIDLDAEVPGESVQITGQYFVPSDASTLPEGLRLTIRCRTETGLQLLAERIIPTDRTSEWVEFDETLPLDVTELAGQGQLLLLLSAAELAGPIYLDDLHVLDPNGNDLWRSPEFE